MHAASIMQLSEICKEIFNFLSKQISVKTFFEIKKLAGTYESDQLNEACDNYAVSNLDKLAHERSFGQLQCEYMTALLSANTAKDLLPSDGKMKVILNWIKADVQNRKELLASLASTIELGDITAEYGKLLATTEPLCYENAQFMTSLYLSNLSRNSKATVEDTDDYRIVTFDKDEKCIRVCRIDDGEWKMLRCIDSDIESYYTAALIEEDVYVVCSSQQVFRLTISCCAEMWENCCMTACVHGPYLRCVNHENWLYVVGNRSMERLIDNRNTGSCWEETLVPPGSCDRSAIVSLDKHVYIIGGIDGVMHEKMWQYEPESVSWKSATSMNFARGTPGACVHEGLIYVAGGYCGGILNVFEQYDPSCEQWTILPSMLAPRAPATLVSVGKRIIVVGTDKKATTVDEYDRHGKTWSSLSFQFSRHYVAAATFSINDDRLDDELSIDEESLFGYDGDDIYRLAPDWYGQFGIRLL